MTARVSPSTSATSTPKSWRMSSAEGGSFTRPLGSSWSLRSARQAQLSRIRNSDPAAADRPGDEVEQLIALGRLAHQLARVGAQQRHVLLRGVLLRPPIGAHRRLTQAGGTLDLVQPPL